jgi:hypothetical protein
VIQAISRQLPPSEARVQRLASLRGIWDGQNGTEKGFISEFFVTLRHYYVIFRVRPLSVYTAKDFDFPLIPVIPCSKFSSFLHGNEFHFRIAILTTLHIIIFGYVNYFYTFYRNYIIKLQL